MTEVVIKDVETGLRDLFRRAYTTNCEIEGEDLSDSDRKTLEDLDPLEILENFKDLLEALLNSKRDFKRTDKSEIAGRCEQFEAMLQKLEGEVRTHIRVFVTQIEQQLKLHSDALQARLDETEQNTAASEKDGKKAEQRVRKESISTLELLGPEKGEESELSHRRVLSMEKDIIEFRGDSKAQKLYEIAEQKHKSLLKLEKECIALRIAYDKRSVELERFKQEYERVLRELQLYRIKKSQEVAPLKKLEEKSLDKMKLARVSPERPLTDRQIRKSTEFERKQDSASGYKYSENSYNSRSKLDPTPQPHYLDVVRRKAHTRTVSERVKRPVTSVRSRPKV